MRKVITGTVLTVVWFVGMYLMVGVLAALVAPKKSSPEIDTYRRANNWFYIQGTNYAVVPWENVFKVRVRGYPPNKDWEVPGIYGTERAAHEAIVRVLQQNLGAVTNTWSEHYK